MFCKKCGTEFTEGTICPNCGEVLKPVEPTIDPGNGKGLAAMILGIVSLAATMFASCSPVGLITSIIGLALASSANKLSATVGAKNNYASAGKIMSIIGLVLSILSIVLASLFIIVYICLYGVTALLVFASSTIDTASSALYY